MRAKNIGKNSFFSVFAQTLIIIAGFFCQRVITLKIGTELVGLNGVTSNVISIFSITELGLSTAIVFHLYRAFAEGAKEKQAALMKLFRNAYIGVAASIAVLGFSFLPFVHLFLRENHFSLSYVRLIYSLWVIKTILGYLLSYKRSIIIADQREYISSLAAMVVSVLNYVSTIIIVMIWGNYEWALGIGIVFEVIVNLCLMAYVDKVYPYLKEYRKQKPNQGLVQSVFSDVKNLFVTTMAQRLLGCTDNLIISSNISTIMVGVYSNYCLITQSLINLMQALANALQPTIGNLIVEGDKKRDEEILQTFTFVFFLLSTILLSGVSATASLFVGRIWLGEACILPRVTVMFMAVNCTFYVINLPIGCYVSASGLFRSEKIVAASAAVTNLVLSLVLVKPMGLNGVLLGSFVAYLILFAGKSIAFYHEYLKKSARRYVFQMVGYMVLNMGEALLCIMLTDKICHDFTIARFLFSIIICIMLPSVINLALFFRSVRFRSLIHFLKTYIKRTHEI